MPKPENRLSPAEYGMSLIGDYLAAVGKRSAGKDVIYRGQASTQWEPKASAFRPSVAGIVTSAQLKGWKSVAQRFVNPRPTNNLEWLILAQHYGIATRLLDWTTNPLIALFFAVQIEGNEDGAVLQAQRSSFKIIDDMASVGVFVRERNQPLLLDSSVSNSRSTAQDSLMTLHTEHDCVPAVRLVYRVPAMLKPNIGVALQQLGITAARVFADLTTAAQQYKTSLSEQRDLQTLLANMGLDDENPADESEDIHGE